MCGLSEITWQSLSAILSRHTSHSSPLIGPPAKYIQRTGGVWTSGSNGLLFGHCLFYILLGGCLHYNTSQKGPANVSIKDKWLGGGESVREDRAYRLICSDQHICSGIFNNWSPSRQPTIHSVVGVVILGGQQRSLPFVLPSNYHQGPWFICSSPDRRIAPPVCLLEWYMGPK